jgi:hypothetical protein
MCEAVKSMSEVANGQAPTGGQASYEGPGELVAAMDDFDASLIINPLTYDEGKHRKSLEESLESIISGAALLADSRYLSAAHLLLSMTFLNISAADFTILTLIKCHPLIAVQEMIDVNELWLLEMESVKLSRNSCQSICTMLARNPLRNWTLQLTICVEERETLGN